jgi:hypothetical protein
MAISQSSLVDTNRDIRRPNTPMSSKVILCAIAAGVPSFEYIYLHDIDHTANRLLLGE